MILVVGLSARILVQSLKNYVDVFSLDVFGDSDTVADSIGWRSIGNADYSIEDDKFLKVFEDVVREFSPSAWVHSSGFEGKCGLINKAESFLTHYGLSEEKITNVRTPSIFFKALRKLNISHPSTVVEVNNKRIPKGWIAKNFHTTGGLGVKKKIL